jgi:hypothetical protein
MKGLLIARAATAAIVFAGVACNDPNVENPWFKGEHRRFYPTSEAVPNLNDAAPNEYFIEIPQGVLRQKLALAADQSLVIGRKVTVTEPPRRSGKQDLAMVASVGDFAIGAGSRVGAVYALGHSAPRSEENVTVGMYAKSVVPFEGYPPSTDLTRVLPGVRSSVEEFRWRLKVPPPQAIPDDLFAVPGQAPKPLPPGSYGALVVPAGAKLRLGAGSFFFESLRVEEGGRLEIDNTSGLVYIWITRSLAILGTMREYSVQPSTLIGYQGTDPPRIATAFRGTLVAPNATVRVPATAEPHSGSFFARAIEVADHAVIEHRTFLGWSLMLPDAGVGCRLCGGSATMTMNRCGAHSRVTPLANSVSSSEKALAAEVELAECLSRVLPEFFACEETWGLAPDGCEKLGLGYRPPSSYEDY